MEGHWVESACVECGFTRDVPSEDPSYPAKCLACRLKARGTPRVVAFDAYQVCLVGVDGALSYNEHSFYESREDAEAEASRLNMFRNEISRIDPENVRKLSFRALRMTMLVVGDVIKPWHCHRIGDNETRNVFVPSSSSSSLFNILDKKEDK